MSSSWNGQALVDKLTRKYGFKGNADAKIRILEWLNDIQKDISVNYQWPSNKIKIKRQVVDGDQEINIAPQVPSKPVIAIGAGGTITDASTLTLKVTFVIFDESGREVNSIESEPSAASNSVTTANPDRSIDITSIDTYKGLGTVKPLTIHRRLYLKVGSNPYYLAKTIENNTDTTAVIVTDPATVYEPPEYSLVAFMATENPLVEESGLYLTETSLDKLLAYDPNLSTGGTPYYYSRISKEKIFLYPKPSSTYTLSYWIYKIPSAIFYDTERPIQLDASLKEVLEAGVTWKFYEDKDSDGQESKKNNYYERLIDAKGRVTKTNGQFPTVREVC